MLPRRHFIKGGLATSLGVLGTIGGWPFAFGNKSFPYILRISCEGGWDQTLVFDDKLEQSNVSTQPGSNRVTAGELTYINHPDRPSVTNFFSSHANSTVIVNGLYCRASQHNRAYLSTHGTNHPTSPHQFLDFLTYYAGRIAGDHTAPYIVFDSPMFNVERSRSTLYLNDSIISSMLTPLPGAHILSTQSESLLREHLELAYELSLLEKNPASIDSAKLDSLQRSMLKEQELASTLTAIDQLIDPNANETLRRALFALHLFSGGHSQCATIRHGQKMGWNTHQDIFQKQSLLFEDLFSSLNQIIAEASNLGVASNLLIIVTSELGRAPSLNQQGGKGVWPYTSALLWGKGLNGGKVVGRSDEYLRGVPIDPVFGDSDVPTAEVIDFRHLYAALLLSAGIDYTDLMPEQSILSDAVVVS